MKFIKLFENHSGYEDFVDGGTMEKPNVSHCVEENEVHYNSLIDKVLIVKYVPEINEQIEGPGEIVPTQLYYYHNKIGSLGVNIYDKVEIDGVEVSISDLDASGGTYLFSTAGEHTVKYTLKDPTLIGVEGDEQTQTITKLGALFAACNNIVSVEIPNSVTSIGYNAFYYCNNLTSVTIPNSVTSIGEYAFEKCSGLTNVTIGNSVTSIGDSAFNDCRSLTSVTIPDSVTSIGDSAFNDCRSLTSVTIPDSVTSIGNNAFCDTNLDGATRTKISNINAYAFCGGRPK